MNLKYEYFYIETSFRWLKKMILIPYLTSMRIVNNKENQFSLSNWSKAVLEDMSSAWQIFGDLSVKNQHLCRLMLKTQI
jgi:hypothetical protein